MPFGQCHCDLAAASAPTQRQPTPPFNFRAIVRDGGTVFARRGDHLLPLGNEGAKARTGMADPIPVFNWSLLIDITIPNRFALWDPRISGI